MQVGFPTLEMPTIAKPKATFLYRVSSKLRDAESLFGGHDLAKVPLIMPSGIKEEQTLISFPCVDTGPSPIDGLRKGNVDKSSKSYCSINPSDQVLHQLRSMNCTPLHSDDTPSFRTVTLKPARLNSLLEEPVRRWFQEDLNSSAIFTAMPHKTPYPVSHDMGYSNRKLPTNVHSTHSSATDVPTSPSYLHSLCSPPATSSSSETFNTSWSDFVNDRAKKTTETTSTTAAMAQKGMCAKPTPSSRSMEDDFSMSNVFHHPTFVSNKTDSTSSSDISSSNTPPPIKGILKSSRYSSRSPSLDDENGGGSTSTNKSFSSGGSKKRVKFLETDTVMSISQEGDRPQIFSINLKEIPHIDMGIIDGYHSQNEFSFTGSDSFMGMNDGTKTPLHSLHKSDAASTKHSAKHIMPSCEDKAIDHNAYVDQSRAVPFTDSRKLNHFPNAVCKNGHVIWGQTPFRDSSKKRTSGTDALNTSPNTTTHSSRQISSTSGSTSHNPQKFSSLSKRSKSKMADSSHRHSTPPLPHKPSLLSHLTTEGSNGSRKTLKGIFSPALSEKENSSLVEAGHRLLSSSKGSKVKGKSHDHKSRPKQAKQGGSFCNEEKTLRIMEWLDTVHSQRETARAPVTRLVAVK